jgi:hypothetical protein
MDDFLSDDHPVSGRVYSMVVIDHPDFDPKTGWSMTTIL